MKKLFVGISLLLLCGILFAQKQVEHQQLMWYAYQNTLKIDSSWSLVTELHERRFRNPDVQHQLLLRTRIQRDLGSGWDMGAGMCVSFQSPNDPATEIDVVLPELRPHLEFNFHQKIKLLNIDHRYKAEARFFHHVNSTFTDLEDGYEYGTIRFRYRLQFFYPILRLKEQKTLRVRFGDELMVNLGENIVHNFFDQNRLFAGLNMVFSQVITLEAGYINWFQQQKSGVNYYNRDILAVALYHSIKSKRTL